MSYIEAAMHRALVRAAQQKDLSTREGAALVLRELFDGEGVYLKQLDRPRPTRLKRASA